MLHVHAIPVADFQDWCSEKGFDIHVHERETVDFRYASARYYGDLKRGGQCVEIKDENILCSPCSNGNSVSECIAQMARDYSEKLIVVGAYTKEREEIKCPRFTCKEIAK